MTMSRDMFVIKWLKGENSKHLSRSFHFTHCLPSRLLSTQVKCAKVERRSPYQAHFWFPAICVVAPWPPHIRSKITTYYRVRRPYSGKRPHWILLFRMNFVAAFQIKLLLKHFCLPNSKVWYHGNHCKLILFLFLLFIPTAQRIEPSLSRYRIPLIHDHQRTQ